MNARALFAAAVFLLAASHLAAQGVPAPSGHQAQGSRLTLPPGWTVFRGSSGLIVPHPAGWQVRELGDGGFFSFRPGADGQAGALVLVQPIRRIEGRALATVQSLGQVFPNFFPQAKASNPRQVSASPELALARIEYQAGSIPFQGSALCLKLGTGGVLYAMASRPQDWRREAPLMAEMLTRFFYAAPGTSSGGSAARLVPWQDPREGAFQCGVPHGWRVEGGLHRFSVTDVRHEVLAESPDGRFLIRIGDAWIPPMVQPGQLMLSMGRHEGSLYSADGLTQTLVLRYLPAADFMTRFYLPQRVGRFGNVRVQPHPQITRQRLQEQASLGIHAVADTAEIFFDAEMQVGPRRGYAFVQTLGHPISGGDGMGLWWVTLFWSFLVEPGREAEAMQILQGMLSSWQFNPQWLAMQQQTTVAAAEIQRRSHQEISEMLYAGYLRRSQSRDEGHETWTRAFRGHVLVEDPTPAGVSKSPRGETITGGSWAPGNSSPPRAPTPDRSSIGGCSRCASSIDSNPTLSKQRRRIMKTNPCLFCTRPALAAILFLVVAALPVYAQWGPPPGQTPYPGPPPLPGPPQSPYPPVGPPAYPPVQPGPSGPYGGGPGGQALVDAIGRFRLSLPQGSVPMGATYNIGLPAFMCQVSITSVAQEQMFQMQQQQFPAMLRQMGARVDSEQPIEVSGRPGRFIAATLRDHMTGTSMHSMNVFISGAAVWVQVMGPEQNAQQMGQVLQTVLSSLQF